MTLSLKKFAPYLIFFAAMLWASDAPFRLHLTKDLPSNFIVLGEHAFDILAALPILFFSWADVKKLSLKGWLSVVAVGVGGSALASVAFTEAFHYVNPSVAILLQKLQPFMAIALAVALLRERLPKRFWLWTFLAIFAAYVISFPTFAPRLYEAVFHGHSIPLFFQAFIPQLFQNETFNPNFVGVLLAIVAALFWGASTVLGKYALQTISFKTMTALRFTVAFAFLLCLNAFQGTLGAVHKMTATDWLFILIIALTSGIVSLFIYYKGLAYTKASVATIAELGFPLAAVVVNAVFINQPITFPQVGGMLALLAAIYFLGRSNAEPETARLSEAAPIS